MTPDLVSAATVASEVMDNLSTAPLAITNLIDVYFLSTNKDSVSS